MDLELYTRFLIALLAVLALIAAVAWVARRFGIGGKLASPLTRARSRNRRLEVVEVMALDPRKRLVLIRRDDREHLLLLAPGRDLVIETGIPASPTTDVLGSRSPSPGDAEASS